MMHRKHRSRNFPAASAQIRGSAAFPDIYGTVRLRQLQNGVLLTAEIHGLPESSSRNPEQPAIFGFHIHSGSACTGTEADPFSNAGSHFNPGQTPHPSHAGDLPPLFGSHGYAYMAVFTDRFTVDEVLGHAIIIHRDPDDFTTQPAGNSGARIACGIIRPA